MSTELYKEYLIRIEREGNAYRAVARGAGQEYLDDTPEEAIAGVKRKIDNIDAFRQMQNMKKETCYKCGEELPKDHDGTVCEKCFEREMEMQ